MFEAASAVFAAAMFDLAKDLQDRLGIGQMIVDQKQRSIWSIQRHRGGPAETGFSPPGRCEATFCPFFTETFT